MAKLNFKIGFESKKLISIIIPKIGGIIIHKIKYRDPRQINGIVNYLWAFGIRRKIWTGIIK